MIECVVIFIKFAIWYDCVNKMKLCINDMKSNAYFHHVVLIRIPIEFIESRGEFDKALGRAQLRHIAQHNSRNVSG